LPLCLEEVRRFPSPPADLFDTIWRGSAPALYDRALTPQEWYAGYVATYVERDVRTVLGVTDLIAFQTFLRLCAGRVGQLLNLSALGADVGITHATAKSWISVLEAGYVAWRMPPWLVNLGKRLVKTPKLHFYDAGVVCWLLGIRSPEQLRDHPLRGPIFETWVASEILKARVHRGESASLCFFRDRKGAEVDVIVEAGKRLFAVEVKSGQTVAPDFFRDLETIAALAAKTTVRRDVERFVVYGGDQTQRRSSAVVVAWSDLASRTWTDEMSGA